MIVCDDIDYFIEDVIKIWSNRLRNPYIIEAKRVRIHRVFYNIWWYRGQWIIQYARNRPRPSLLRVVHLCVPCVHGPGWRPGCKDTGTIPPYKKM